MSDSNMKRNCIIHFASICTLSSAYSSNVCFYRRHIVTLHVSQACNEDSEPESFLAKETAESVMATDRRLILSWLGYCFTGACALSTYEDFDVTHLHPNRGALRRVGVLDNIDLENELLHDNEKFGRRQIGAATRGMGAGAKDRLQVRSSYTEQTAPIIVREDGDDDYIPAKLWNPDEIPSYNEVMEQHRVSQVSRWRQNYRQSESGDFTSKDKAIQATSIIYKCLNVLDTKLKPAAENYDWELLKASLSDRLFRIDLEVASTTLLYATFPNERQDAALIRRDEIGYDWGSCAWRHCGALADTQEVLAELYNSAGMLEPYECLFCLDIAERALRDILAVVPRTYHPPDASIKPYIPYESMGDAYDGLASIEIDGGSGDSGLYKELGNPQFLKILDMLRNKDISN